jgi:hypothetical protein
MKSRKPLRALLAAIALSSGIQVASSHGAAADASSHASCVGIEASSISPNGSSDEFPGGMPEVNEFLRDLAAQLGVPKGALFASFAKLHEGSHEACDAA